jgi:hypothetical protein
MVQPECGCIKFGVFLPRERRVLVTRWPKLKLIRAGYDSRYLRFATPDPARIR